MDPVIDVSSLSVIVNDSETSDNSSLINVNNKVVESNYQNLLDKLKEKVLNINIRASTIHLIIKYVMEEIEDTPYKGVEQKELALKLIRALIVDITENEDEKVLLKLLDDGTIGNMIDLIVDATRGKLNINNVVQVGSGCLNSCLPYLLSSKKK